MNLSAAKSAKPPRTSADVSAEILERRRKRDAQRKLEAYANKRQFKVYTNDKTSAEAL